MNEKTKEILYAYSPERNVDAEYNTLRLEILQYMEEYQNLRNMMYVGTAALLGINTAASFSVYLYLMPLIIIIPSYILFYDYWKSVSVASLYMQVFLERDTIDEGVSYHMWETHHNEFNREVKLDDNGKIDPKYAHDLRWSDMNCHHIPYFLCAALCFILYVMEVVGIVLNTDNMKAIINDVIFECILGVILFLVCCAVFYFFRAPDRERITDTWIRIKSKRSTNTKQMNKNGMDEVL
ncbi:MAG: hypothetical protein LUH07_04255 [Lachnospiraceae bacterium]|nr:hypothetical protein [Lachnospiraceae bacterium]